MFFEIVKQQTASRSGAHLLPNSVALSCGSLFAGYMIRRTGKYRKLIIITAMFPVASLIAVAFMDRNSGWAWQWLAVAPSGFGFSSIVTATLSKSCSIANLVHSFEPMRLKVSVFPLQN
jgi:MFS family permease